MVRLCAGQPDACICENLGICCTIGTNCDELIVVHKDHQGIEEDYIKEAVKGV